MALTVFVLLLTIVPSFSFALCSLCFAHCVNWRLFLFLSEEAGMGGRSYRNWKIWKNKKYKNIGERWTADDFPWIFRYLFNTCVFDLFSHKISLPEFAHTSKILSLYFTCWQYCTNKVISARHHSSWLLNQNTEKTKFPLVLQNFGKFCLL